MKRSVIENVFPNIENKLVRIVSEGPLLIGTVNRCFEMHANNLFKSTLMNRYHQLNFLVLSRLHTNLVKLKLMLSAFPGFLNQF